MESIGWLLFIGYISVACVVYGIAYWVEVVLGLPQIERNRAEEDEGPVEPSDESYEELRRLVEQVIEQVFELPELLNHSGVPGRKVPAAPEFDAKKYEELLATAVLNRVVEKFEQEQSILRGRRNWTETRNDSALRSSVSDLSSDEPRSESSQTLTRKRPMSINVDSVKSSNFAHSDGDTDGVVPHSPTSDEEYLSDYIQHHRIPLPHLGSVEQLDAEPKADGQNSNGHGEAVSNDGSATWEANWMFKKRNSGDIGVNGLVSGSVSNGSVGMLVPSPTEEVKALIGDRIADEVSDLSEAEGSDSELSDTDEDDVNTSTKQSVDELIDLEIDRIASEATPNTEKYEIDAVLRSIQTLDDVVSKAEATLVSSDNDPPKIVHVLHKSSDEFRNNDQDVEIPCAASTLIEPATTLTPLIIDGSIAEREHKKWENVQDVPGNPYSPEALQKRLSTQSWAGDGDLLRMASSKSETASEAVAEIRDNDEPERLDSPQRKSDIHRYGRDYYINDSKYAAGSAANNWQPTSPTTSNSVSAIDIKQTPFLTSTIRPKHPDINNNNQQNDISHGNTRFRLARRAYSMRSLRNGYGTDPWSGESLSCDDDGFRSDRNATSPRAKGKKSGAFHSKSAWTESKATAEFEANMLRGNLRRDCLRSRNGTANFVVNPLFEDD